MFTTHKQKSSQSNTKKKPPPRPPPPNLSKYKSKSTFNLNNQLDNLIEWSPPNSPKAERSQQFGGSVSSSFSSSTSSLASSKKSFEFDLPTNWPTNIPVIQTTMKNTTSANSNPVNVPSLFGPTIIRAKEGKKNLKIKPDITYSVFKEADSPPMPSIPPPSPPKEVADIDTPYGIAEYDFPASHPSDLGIQIGDVVFLIRRINSEWLYGKIVGKDGEREGMFPANFIDIKVPLPNENNTVTALFEFRPQMAGDLALKPGQQVTVTRIVNSDWLYGTSNGESGQFPSNFVDRIPKI
ncbi:uncharacterized protein B0303.7 [Aethina tumida]|uniref:uncharacterized protein B0303.7 n=1 Tax=Aethina tumida TaxID=116153 RepID=UPI002147F3DD|nr:uncharacterized protein B0303.7 [Aethina tumida]